MDVISENARAVRPRRWDNEWWTTTAYECRDKRAVVGRAAAEVAAHECIAVRNASGGESVGGDVSVGEEASLDVGR